MAEDSASLRADRRRVRREQQRQRRRRVVGVVGLLLLAVVLMAGAIVYASRDEAPPPEPPLRTITLTIPEGYSREQTAQLAREVGLRGDYMKESEGHEGFLFPDTFELEKRAPASDLVQLQLEDFKRRIAGVDMRYARSKNLTILRRR